MNIVQLLKNSKLITSGSVELRGGEKSDYYFDVKRAYGSPRLLCAIALEIAKDTDKEITCIAAKGYGGIPLATIISLISETHLSIVRDSVRQHGLGKLIEGYVPNREDRVMIVDDVITSGGSLLETAKVINSTGAKIDRAYVVVRRKKVEMPFPVDYLVDAEELI